MMDENVSRFGAQHYMSCHCDRVPCSE